MRASFLLPLIAWALQASPSDNFLLTPCSDARLHARTTSCAGRLPGVGTILGNTLRSRPNCELQLREQLSNFYRVYNLQRVGKFETERLARFDARKSSKLYKNMGLTAHNHGGRQKTWISIMPTWPLFNPIWRAGVFSNN